MMARKPTRGTYQPQGVQGSNTPVPAPGLPADKVASQQYPRWAWRGGGNGGSLPTVGPVLRALPFGSVSSVSSVGFVCSRAVVDALVCALMGGGFRGNPQDVFVRTLSFLSQYFRNLPTRVWTGENFCRLCRRRLEESGRC